MDASASACVTEPTVAAGPSRAMPPNTSEFMSKMIQNLRGMAVLVPGRYLCPGF